jgi:geranylgeranyl reductase
MKYDVIVAGGGPGGSTCAEILAKNGMDIILFEKGKKDRYKACAGGLMWHNELDFGPLPPEIVERNVDYLLFHGPNESAIIKNGKKTKIGQLTYRNRLDCYLREKAARAGAIIENNSEIKDVFKHEDHIEVEVAYNSSKKNVKADAIVVATGVHRNVLQRKLNVEHPSEIEQAIQAEFYLPSHVINERFGGGAYELFFDSKIAPHGYAWIFTKNEGLSVGMCNKTVKIDQFRDLLKHHPIINNKIMGAKPIKIEGKHLWAAPIPDRLIEHVYGDKVLIIGDAAGFTDRFTYEGIWHARISGKLAAETLIKAKKRKDFTISYLQKYQRKCSRIIQVIRNSQRMHHLAYHSGYMDLLTDTMAEILQDSVLAEKIGEHIQILLEGFLEPGNVAAALSLEFQTKLIETLEKKIDKITLRKFNRDLEFSYVY